MNCESPATLFNNWLENHTLEVAPLVGGRPFGTSTSLHKRNKAKWTCLRGTRKIGDNGSRER